MALVSVALAACLAVSAVSDHVRAGDLAKASGAFAALDPDTAVGWAPAPGVRRVFPAAELRRIAARLGAAPAPDAALCVERPTAPIDPERLVAAIRSQAPEAQVKLLDFSRAPAPEGELVFPRNGVRRAPGGTYLWNGSVRYAGNRRFAIWARIAAGAAARVVVAATDLKPGRAIEAWQVRLETRDELFASRFVNTPGEAVGKWPRRPLRAGTALEPQWLEPAPEISRGETVNVDVWSGAAHLRLEARAESAGAVGQQVALRNPLTQKRFLARVDAKGRASAGPAPRRPGAGTEKP